MMLPLFWWNENLYWRMKVAALQRHMILFGGRDLADTWHERVINAFYPV